MDERLVVILNTVANTLNLSLVQYINGHGGPLHTAIGSYLWVFIIGVHKRSDLG